MNSSYPICQSFSRDFFRICLQLSSLGGNVAVYNTSLYLADMENNNRWLDEEHWPKLDKQKTAIWMFFFLSRANKLFDALPNNACNETHTNTETTNLNGMRLKMIAKPDDKF